MSVYGRILYDETLKFFKENGVKYYFFDPPKLQKAKNIDDFEKGILKKGLKWVDIRKDEKLVECFFHGEDFNWFVPKQYYNGKFRVLKDANRKLVNVVNGVRATTDTPMTYKNNIYTLGPCLVEGKITSDKYTIASCIQRLVNKDFENKYRVINYGVIGGFDPINDFERILNTGLNRGDIVIHLVSGMSYRIIDKYGFTIRRNLSSLFDRPHNYGYWSRDKGGHMTPTAYRVVAEYMYNTISPDLTNDEPTEPQKTVKYQFENEVDTFLDDKPDFKNYLDELKSIKEKNNVNGKIGSIVMNCNPFTLGHRYLIEQAAEQVDHLYIFVVEEDKSVFPFKDRMELVKGGVADLGDKVTVLPSGKWIISLLTFPEYFNKDDLQGAAIDPSNDIKLFGKYICPALGINKRFVGEEPFDLVTRQYNETMRREFPILNIDFQEIPRKSVEGDDVISATKVRKALKSNDLETLKKYVPQTTFNYLMKNHEKIVKAIDSKYNY